MSYNVVFCVLSSGKPLSKGIIDAMVSSLDGDRFWPIRIQSKLGDKVAFGFMLDEKYKSIYEFSDYCYLDFESTVVDLLRTYDGSVVSKNSMLLKKAEDWSVV